METFAERVRRLRIAKGYTQAEVGERVGVVGHAVGAWERAIAEPSAHRIAQIARALGVSTDELLTGHTRPVAPANEVIPRNVQPRVVETFGQRIRRLRLKAGFRRQEDLAATLAVDRGAIAHWECDDSAPMPHHQHTLRKLFGVSLHFLIYGEEDEHTVRLHNAIRINAPRERLLALIGADADV